MTAARRAQQAERKTSGSTFARYPWLGPALFALVAAAVFAGAWWYTQADEPKVPAAGEEAPDFALQEVNGGEVQLSQLRGEPVVLVFYRFAG